MCEHCSPEIAVTLKRPYLCKKVVAFVLKVKSGCSKAAGHGREQRSPEWALVAYVAGSSAALPVTNTRLLEVQIHEMMCRPADVCSVVTSYPKGSTVNIERSHSFGAQNDSGKSHP